MLDFGLARQVSVESQSSMAGFLAGTLRYMSPEQIRGSTVTGASDIFSLGLVLYELLTGSHAFAAHSPFETAHAIAANEPRKPSDFNSFVPSSLDSLVLSMLAKHPRERPLADVVARTLTQIQSPAESPHTAMRIIELELFARLVRKQSWILTAGSALLLAAVLLWYGKERMFSRGSFAFRQVTTQARENRVTAAAISPDGKSMAYAQAGGGVFLRTLATSATARCRCRKLYEQRQSPGLPTVCSC